jgi:hypothetical protein
MTNPHSLPSGTILVGVDGSGGEEGRMRVAESVAAMGEKFRTSR